jgi:predicted RNA-binding protein with TRAM domain
VAFFIISNRSYTEFFILRNMKTREPKILEGVSITEMSSEGKGIAKIDGKVYFVRGAVPEDVVDIRVKKSKSSYAEGRCTSVDYALFVAHCSLHASILAPAEVVNGNILAILHN